jgi:glycosyltransferase involved in cell wall biosynthesis
MTVASSQPTLGLALIAKDEAETLPYLLESVAGAFDQVALLDTGSSDSTVEVFEGWAESQDLPLGFEVGRFEWCEDFAAARNAADELLATDWLASADADDEIVGAGALRRVVADMPPEVGGLICGYRVPGNGREVEVEGLRQRVVRRPAPPWEGRLHEDRRTARSGPLVRVAPALVYWRSRRDNMREDSRRRNERILRKWIEEQPGDSTPLGLLAVQTYIHGDRREAVALLSRYAELRGSQADARRRELVTWALGGLDHLASTDTRDDTLAAAYISILLERPPHLWQSACAEPTHEVPCGR